jgi:hypothetical protein
MLQIKLNLYVTKWYMLYCYLCGFKSKAGILILSHYFRQRSVRFIFSLWCDATFFCHTLYNVREWAGQLWNQSSVLGRSRRFFSVAHSVQQKSSNLIFRTSRSGSDVTYDRHHNSSCFNFPIFVHSWHFSVFHSLRSIMPHIQGPPKKYIHTLTKENSMLYNWLL